MQRNTPPNPSVSEGGRSTHSSFREENPSKLEDTTGPFALVVRWTRTRLGSLIKSPYALVVLVSALAYSVSLSSLSYLKYYTFNATYADLGLENQVQWLLLHGWIPNYYASGFNLIYPLQYEKPVLFLITPLYAIYPHPTALLVIGSFALGLAVLPLYVFSAQRLGNRLYAMAISLSYLVFFPVASANLFDFHEEDLFPLFFFAMLAAWSLGRTRLMYLAAALTAAVNPLCLVISGFFMFFTSLAPINESNPLKVLYLGARSFARDRWKLCFTIGLGAVLLTYALSGYLFIPGVGSGSGQSTPGNVLFFDINLKFQTLIYLYAALAFIPILSWRSQLVLLPYVGYVFYSTNSANWALFGLMYPLLGTGPLYLAVVEAIRGSRIQEPTEQIDAGPESSRSRQALLRRVRGKGLTTSQKMLIGLAVSSLLFGTIYFPYSPVNQYVTGGYFNGNHNLEGITTVTPQVKFLWQVIGLIPPSASVLSQNDIPGVTGRQYSQIDIAYNPSIPYDYLLMDSSFTYFSPISAILPIAQADLDSGNFGVVAEGQGALLIARNYTGPVQLFEPFNQTYSGNQMSLFSGSVEGSGIVNNKSAFSFWYGPYVTLYPGHYKAEFTLESNSTVPENSTALTLDVVTGGGATIFASSVVYLGNFTAPGAPATFTEPFNITSITQNMEFRGMYPTGSSTLTLLRITVQQVGAMG